MEVYQRSTEERRLGTRVGRSLKEGELKFSTIVARERIGVQHDSGLKGRDRSEEYLGGLLKLIIFQLCTLIRTCHRRHQRLYHVMNYITTNHTGADRK